MNFHRTITGMSPEPLSASGSEKLSLPSLQSKMKCDPEGYESELHLIYNQFKSSLELFKQQADLGFKSVSGIRNDPAVAKDLGDRAMFLAHVTPFYPTHLAHFPAQLAEFIRSSAGTLPSGLCLHVTQALILLMNRKMVDMGDNLALFMELQTFGNKALRKLAYSHVVHSIKRMNQKHKNEVKNRALQNVLFEMLRQEDETKAKRVLITLRELHQRKVWFDERTANAICTACFHPSSRIMIACLSFLLDYEKFEDDDSDASSSEDEAPHTPQIVLNRESIYKAHHQGTIASKKKKKAKLQRAMRSMKKQQRLSSEKSNSNYHTPLNHLKDPQGFAEKLFSRLQTCNERFEVKMMMLKVIARTIGLHRLILLNFYPFLQKYIQPHQRDVTSLLAAAVQACHDMVPPDAIQPLFKQLVNQFVHDHSRPEAIAVGLNVTRELCLRIPLLMTEDLLQDLALYKKSHEKAVSIAARSLIGLFREICPSLLIKKDRGRPTNPKARPKAYGEVNVLSNVPGVELLEEDDGNEDGDDADEASLSGTDDDLDHDEMVASSDDEDNQIANSDSGSEEDSIVAEDVDSDGSIDDNDSDVSGDEDDEEDEDDEDEEDEENESNNNDAKDSGTGVKDKKAKKRKVADFDKQLNDADASLRALKRLAKENMEPISLDSTDGFLSNEDFQRIKELKAKKDARFALTQHGLLKKGADSKSPAFKIPNSDELSIKRVDPAKLEVHVKKRMSKEERLALVRAGREDRGKYQARAAIKQKKTGGMSNRQKEHKKPMPLAAKRAKVAKSRIDKKKKQQRAGKQFRGKKGQKINKIQIEISISIFHFSLLHSVLLSLLPHFSTRMASRLGACTPRGSHFYLLKHKHPLILLLEQKRTAPFGRTKIAGRGSLRIRVSDGGDSYLGMWKKAVENDKKTVEFERIVEKSSKIDADDDQSVEPVEDLEKKSEEFEKILGVSKEERDRVQRMQVVDRAAAAIAAARAILADKNKSLRTDPGSGGGSGGAVEPRQEGNGTQVRSVIVPQSEISGTGTPGPDFWSWAPPQGGDKSSDDVSELLPAPKPSAQSSNPVLEKEPSVGFLSIPLESKLEETNRNPPLPPFQSLMEVGKVDVSESSVEATSLKDDHELGAEFSAHAAEAAHALDTVDEASLSGVNTDGSRWWKESGIEQRPDGVVCRWTMTRGVSADQVTEWQDKYWEAADEFGHKELGSEKLGRNATGNVWREYWTESMWQNRGLVHMEKTADKWGKNGKGDEWQEKWWEHYDASGQAEKWAHKWCSIDPNTPLEAGHAHIWHERWGEKYDGHGGSDKYTDKWAERCEGDGWAKWGDKWDEHFNPNGHGVKQGETWWEGKYGERWNRTWGEGHNGSGWVHKYGKSSSGEHWDTHEPQDTWYERFPHFGFYHCFENSVQLREVPKPSDRP